MDTMSIIDLKDKCFAPLTAASIDCGLVLGSGWGSALPEQSWLAEIPYAALKGYGESTVQGHSGRLLLWQWEGRRVLAFCGRRHYYEGCSLEQVIYPIELMRQLCIPRVLLTNAAGGINPALRPGECMIFSDHLNLSGITPLRGAQREGWGTRFPDMTQVYDEVLQGHLASGNETWIKRGVYAFSVGPAYETPAEIRAWKALGADAIGMSTVLEATLAHACGMQVAAISCITNAAAGLSEQALSHREVLDIAQLSRLRMATLLRRFVTF